MMNMKWENMEMVMVQAGGLLLTRRRQSLRRAGGDILKYHPSTNTFGIMDASGVPRTMFKPAEGMQYWLIQ